MRNPESALVMHAELPKEVKKALQYGAKEMNKLKDDELKKRKLITQKTATLMALVQRSEALVVAAEQVLIFFLSMLNSSKSGNHY